MFEKFARSSLTNQQVLTELEKIQILEWDIFTGDGVHQYIFKPDDNKTIEIKL